MSRYLVMTPALILAGTAVLAAPPVAASTSSHVATGVAWGQAKEVPGTDALKAFGNGSTSSVSCASTGNCSAGGWYLTSSAEQEAFIVSQT